jgi:hypothetical protein
MKGFSFYTAKIDELHVVDNEAMTGHTICGQPMVSSNYFENDRFINIDKSRKERRHVCLTCLASMMERVNTTIHNLGLEIDTRRKMDEDLCLEITKLKTELVNEEQRKGSTPVAVEGEHQELFEYGPFMGRESIEGLPKCAIPSCNSEEIRYWIHPKGKECKYFCGDCPESQIEILDKFAESIGEEVGSYDAPLWAVEMVAMVPDNSSKTWLIKAHNMAAAVARAREGDFDKEAEQGIRLNEVILIPVDVRKANKDEEEEFGE